MSQDVIVLGLGAMGASTVYQLAKRGVRVTGFEQFQIGHSLGSSHGQSRILRKAYFEHPNYVPLLESSYKLWADLSKEPCFLYELPYGSFYGFPKGVEIEGGIKVAEHSGDLEVENPEALDRTLDSHHFANAKKFIQEAFPGVTDKLIEFKTCMYTMTPDENFILDIHPEHYNVSFAAGFSGHGFKFASVIGEVLADFASSGETSHPVDFLRMRTSLRPH